MPVILHLSLCQPSQEIPLQENSRAVGHPISEVLFPDRLWCNACPSSDLCEEESGKRAEGSKWQLCIHYCFSLVSLGHSVVVNMKENGLRSYAGESGCRGKSHAESSLGGFCTLCAYKAGCPKLKFLPEKESIQVLQGCCFSFYLFFLFFQDSLCPSFLSSPCTSISLFSAFSFRGALVSDLYYKRQLTVFSMMSRILRLMQYLEKEKKRKIDTW